MPRRGWYRARTRTQYQRREARRRRSRERREVAITTHSPPNAAYYAEGAYAIPEFYTGRNCRNPGSATLSLAGPDFATLYLLIPCRLLLGFCERPPGGCSVKTRKMFAKNCHVIPTEPSTGEPDTRAKRSHLRNCISLDCRPPTAQRTPGLEMEPQARVADRVSGVAYCAFPILST